MRRTKTGERVQDLATSRPSRLGLNSIPASLPEDEAAAIRQANEAHLEALWAEAAEAVWTANPKIRARPTPEALLAPKQGRGQGKCRALGARLRMRVDEGRAPSKRGPNKQATLPDDSEGDE